MPRLFHCCCLVWAVAATAVTVIGTSTPSSDFTARINKISEDLDKALDDVLQLDGPNYTDLHARQHQQPDTNFTGSRFNPSGMASLYNITQMFMEVLISKDVMYDRYWQRIDETHLEESWKDILKSYGAAIALVVALFLFAVLMPVCGLCFCCSRCCCKSRSKPFDKRGDLCRKICFATFLIILGTLLLFGVVCAFVSNQQMHDGVKEFPATADKSLNASKYYLRRTNSEFDILLNVNYHEFETLLFAILDKCSSIVLDQLREYSKATALTQVVKIVNGLEDIKSNLTFMKATTNELRTNASQLNDGLRKAKGDLLQILNECHRLSECNELSDKYISQLGTDIDFNNLPDISKEIDQLTLVLNSDITGTVREGQEAFDNIRVEINKTIGSQIPKVKNSVRKAGSEITAIGANISRELKNLEDNIGRFSEGVWHDSKAYLVEYSPYQYYVGIGVGCVLLTVTLCITLGLICGVCGKRPDAYSDDCCNKGAGSRFLMLGVVTMFLFATVLAVIAIAYFAVGMATQRIICDYLRNPRHDHLRPIFSLFDKDRYLRNMNIDITNNPLVTCYNNASFYHIQSRFQLDDVNVYLDKFEINKTLNDLTHQINANTSVVILSQSAKDHLEELVRSGIAEISYDKFIDELARNLTSVDLGFLASKLEELIAVMKDKATDAKELYPRLQVCALHLRTYQSAYVQPMTTSSKQLISVAENLKESLKFNKMSFKHAIHDLIEELEAAQKYLKLNGSATMVKIAYNFGRGIEKQVHNYLNRAIVSIKNDVGKCGPVSAAINSTVDASCDKILQPWNGFWFSIVWCLVLFMPIIIFSVKLSTLYQKLEPYPGPLVEAEYLYDAYADRDNMPLSSHGGEGRSKKKYKKKPKGYDGRGAYTAECNEIQGASHYQDARYSDMAPKHWEEFPAGGPPQYQRAPTEYERPPPYYFPESERQQ